MNEKEWLESTIKKLSDKMAVVSQRSQLKLPFTSADGMHDDNSFKITQWTNGFWGGMLWLMFMLTEDEHYRDLAIQHEKKLDDAFLNFERLNHDVGFLWMPTAGLHYKLEKNEDSLRRLYFAACSLASRFHVKGQFFRAWNKDPGYSCIIDCLLNIPLLYVMSEELDDPRFRLMAMAHADTVMEQHIREDGSIIHISTHDPQTGEVTGYQAGQGYDVDSAWSRGQAWAIYGYAISYMHTGEKRYLDMAKKTANYFLASCCDDYLPRCDFRAPAEPLVYDASAGAIAACGMLDIAAHCGDLDAEKYAGGAMRILQAMEANFCDWSEDTDFILTNSSRRYGVMTPNGRNVPIIFGDYFFIEAILHLQKPEFRFW